MKPEWSVAKCESATSRVFCSQDPLFKVGFEKALVAKFPLSIMQARALNNIRNSKRYLILIDKVDQVSSSEDKMLASLTELLLRALSRAL